MDKLSLVAWVDAVDARRVWSQNILRGCDGRLKKWENLGKRVVALREVGHRDAKLQKKPPSSSAAYNTHCLSSSFGEPRPFISVWYRDKLCCWQEERSGFCRAKNAPIKLPAAISLLFFWDFSSGAYTGLSHPNIVPNTNFRMRPTLTLAYSLCSERDHNPAWLSFIAWIIQCKK